MIAGDLGEARFGTGYSALSYIKKFHVDYLKIDQSFVHDLVTSPNDLVLCEAIIVMAHKLGLKVIAEGGNGGAEIPACRNRLRLRSRLLVLEADAARGIQGMGEKQDAVSGSRGMTIVLPWKLSAGAP